MIKTYEFGCHAPLIGLQSVEVIISQRHKLWNMLVEIEHKYRQEYRTLTQGPMAQQFGASLETIEELRKRIKQAKKKPPVRETGVAIAVERKNA